ncbi:MAG: hypothetical protein LBD87_06990 [Prevotellaceae bacterium]|jgi:hypothetical protein|nr:hypothetical protein [Prevotellaceae bacterium]
MGYNYHPEQGGKKEKNREELPAFNIFLMKTGTALSLFRLASNVCKH